MVIALYVRFFQLTSEVSNFCLGTIAPYAEEFSSGRILPIHHWQKFPIWAAVPVPDKTKKEHKLISGQQIIST